MLLELFDTTGTHVGHHLKVDASDTVFLKELGYVRDMDGTDFGRFAYKLRIPEEEIVETYHYDFIGYDEVFDFIMRHLENGECDLEMIRAYIVERSMGDGRYVYSTHECDHYETCPTCAQIEAELQATEVPDDE